MIEHLEKATLDLLAHDVLPPAGFVVNVRPIESDHVGEKSLRKAVLAHDVHRTTAALGSEFEVAVAFDVDETVALHSADRLRHGWARVT